MGVLNDYVLSRSLKSAVSTSTTAPGSRTFPGHPTSYGVFPCRLFRVFTLHVPDSLQNCVCVHVVSIINHIHLLAHRPAFNITQSPNGLPLLYNINVTNPHLQNGKYCRIFEHK